MFLTTPLLFLHKANISNKMHNKKRILLIVNSGLLNSGVPKVISDIIVSLHSEYGFDIMVQSSREEYYDSSFKQMGCRIIYTKHKPSGRLSVVYLFSIWVLLLLKVFHKTKYHAIHSFTAYQSGIDCFIASLCGIKIRISNTHGTVNLNNSIFYGTYQRICRYLIRRYATHKIGVSKQAAESVYDKGSFEVIYNSVPLTELGTTIKEPHICLNFLQVGYYNDNKNQLFSLSLIKELVNRQCQCHMYFIGFDNHVGYEPLIDDYIHSNNLESFVTKLPHDYPKEKIYPIIDFMLLPSRREGLSLVALECQAANIKCLVSTSIPDDVNIGLLHKLPLDNINLWISTIYELYSKDEKVDIETAIKFSRENFKKSISSLYTNVNTNGHKRK